MKKKYAWRVSFYAYSFEIALCKAGFVFLFHYSFKIKHHSTFPLSFITNVHSFFIEGKGFRVLML